MERPKQLPRHRIPTPYVPIGPFRRSPLPIAAPRNHHVPEHRGRRLQLKPPLRQPVQHAVRFGPYTLDFTRAELECNNQPVDLTPTEYRLLKVFVEAAGHVFTRQQLIDAAWDPGTFITDRSIDTHVWSLRKKIEADPAAPQFLHGVRGIGYRFDL